MNWKKFCSMSMMQKAQWLLQYYGITALVCILVAAILIKLAVSILLPGEVPTAEVLILDDYIHSEECLRIQNDVKELLGSEVSIGAYPPSDPLQMQAFAVRLNGDDVDLIIIPQDFASQMSEGYLIDWEELPGEPEMLMAGTTSGKQRDIQTLQLLRTYFRDYYNKKQ